MPVVPTASLTPPYPQHILVFSDTPARLHFFFFNYLFIFWLRWVFVAARGLSLVMASGGHSSLWCVGFSSRWLLLSTGSRHVGLVAPRHVGSSWTRAQTRVPCLGRRILNHCATREAQDYTLNTYLISTPNL